MLVTQARYVAPDISGVSQSRVKDFIPIVFTSKNNTLMVNKIDIRIEFGGGKSKSH